MVPFIDLFDQGLEEVDLGSFIDLFDQGLEEVDLGPFIDLFDQGLEEVDLGPFIDFTAHVVYSNGLWLCYSIIDYNTIPQQCILYKFTNTVQLYAIHVYREGPPGRTLQCCITYYCTKSMYTARGHTVLSDTLWSLGHRSRRKPSLRTDPTLYPILVL